MDLVVAKFGGTSVGNGERIQKAAQSVVNEYMKGNQVVVVVSAVNKTTDELVALSDSAVGDSLTDKQKAEILSMGELTSIRLFYSALEARGVNAEYIDPYSDLWPVMTDTNPLNAEIDLDLTMEKSQKLKDLLNQGIIPVICGFLGKGPHGEITTLGRGGSDVTAFLLGQCLNADEVIIVTDVAGVMSTDPNKFKGAELLSKISVEEMRDLASHGAQVLHPHALMYKDPLIHAKIISYEPGDLSVSGTIIEGPFDGERMKCVAVHDEPISIISIVGDSMLKKTGLLAQITTAIADDDINIFGISAGQNSISAFINKSDANEAMHTIHELVKKSDVLSSVSLGGDTAMITLVDPDFIETPGVITDITEPLRENNINIIEISSSQTAIVVFVDWEDGQKAYNLVRSVLK